MRHALAMRVLAAGTLGDSNGSRRGRPAGPPVDPIDATLVVPG
jgi:hypothetical protein